MTEHPFFDTDCLSAFLWINETNILLELYGGKIIVPEPVYQELCSLSVPHIKKRTDAMIISKRIFVQTIETGTEEYQLYSELVQSKKGQKSIDKGEASGIALAKAYRYRSNTD